MRETKRDRGREKKRLLIRMDRIMHARRSVRDQSFHCEASLLSPGRRLLCFVKSFILGYPSLLLPSPSIVFLPRPLLSFCLPLSTKVKILMYLFQLQVLVGYAAAIAILLLTNPLYVAFTWLVGASFTLVNRSTLSPLSPLSSPLHPVLI